MVVESTITFVICAYHYYSEFKSRSGEVYSIKFDSDLQQVDGFLWALRFPPLIKVTATI